MKSRERGQILVKYILIPTGYNTVVFEHRTKILTKRIFVLSISRFLNCVWAFFTGQEFDKICLCVGLLNRVWAMCQRLLQYSHSQHQQWYWENWESQERQIPGKCRLVHRNCISRLDWIFFGNIFFFVGGLLHCNPLQGQYWARTGFSLCSISTQVKTCFH